MDQEAFRQLVSTSSAVAGPSSNRAFGKAHKRHPAASSTTSSTTKPSDLKPHKIKPNPHKSSDGSSYIDRASARRSGIANSEFSDIEALHRDFEERIAAAETEEERQRLCDQISSVGGDAKYSVLVKGLDWALLAQNKARIERESGAGNGEGEEGDLESAFQEGRAEKDGKRSREDIVEAIRRRREAKSAATNPASGFRPIGFKPIGGAEKPEEDSAEYKWVNGKRMRKKKNNNSAVEQSTPKDIRSDQAVEAVKSDPIGQKAEDTTPTLDAADVNVMQSTLPTEKERPSGEIEQGDEAPVSRTETAPQPLISSDHTTINDLPTKSTQPAPAPAPQEDDDDDDDEDIFVDVGGCDGIPDTKEDEDSPSEQDAIQPASVTPPIAARSPNPPPPPPPPAAAPSPPQTLTEPSPQEDRQPTLLTPTEPKTTSETHPSSLPATTPPTQAPTPSSSLDPKPKSKKSKWDDDLDDAKKKKKKKKHH
ncbi:uncharacterized protein SPSC_01355 [Sporisorium scitamineum]|uniref:RED-like N-terminal domain-containing protein n=1 Tax=Sporisorium scitamineum TaxID=49012 RepID=A0A127Z9S4_9BASI|nr:uncharacterized protein SPSC_01355 [Sporisorium scitamineum]